MTSSENPQNDGFINWRSEYFALFHEYDILVDNYIERGRKIQELMGVIAQLESAEEEE